MYMLFSSVFCLITIFYIFCVSIVCIVCQNVSISTLKTYGYDDKLISCLNINWRLKVPAILEQINQLLDKWIEIRYGVAT